MWKRSTTRLPHAWLLFSFVVIPGGGVVYCISFRSRDSQCRNNPFRAILVCVSDIVLVGVDGIIGMMSRVRLREYSLPVFFLCYSNPSGQEGWLQGSA